MGTLLAGGCFGKHRRKPRQTMDIRTTERYQRLQRELQAEQAKPNPNMPHVERLMRELDELQMSAKDVNPRHFGNNPVE